MAKSDGSVVINTRVNTDGFGKGAADLKTQFTNAAKSAAKMGAAVSAAFGVAAIGLVKGAVEAYANYEQLIGGVETLFKDSAGKVAANAENAFYTVGMSANEYMETVTSFSASLISSLGGDTSAAADIADMALTDMADNANKMGSSLESIKTAYQGFAKQQYQLLDNLKLGYGGTKTEMERLLKDAEKLTGQKYDINNLADVYGAIHAIQEELGIAGTTANEAEKTIIGAANMTKAAWENVLKALGGGGDLEAAINNLVFSITKLFENVMPVVERALIGIGQLIEQAAPALVETVAAALIKAIPSLLNAIYQMIIGLAKGIYQGIVSLFTGATKTMEKQMQDTKAIAKNNSDAADSAKDLAENTEEAGKAAKKTVAGFDELTILAEQKSGEDMDLSDAAASTAAPAASSAWDAATNSVAQTTQNIAAVLGTSVAMLALGAILTFTGANIPLGLGLMAVGAIGLASTIAQNWDTIAEALRGPIGTIVAIVSGALLVLGAVLAFSGASLGLGIGLMIAGAAGLGVTVAANWDSIVEALRGPIGKIVAIVSGALLVLGAVLLFTGAGIPLGLGLMAAGAVGLAATMAANWNTIGDKIKAVFASILSIVSGASVVLGVLLCLTGAAFPLGLGLIFAGLKGTTAAANMSDNPVTRFVKNMVNTILGFINMLIDGINKLFEIDFPGLTIAGVEIIPRINTKLLNIPKIPLLAKGAVIPPNAPFAAILGDQRHGTNIEAPLSTIQEAVALVMEDYAAANIAGHEATVSVLREILEAVLGIHIGDDVVGQAVARYNARMAIIRGGSV